MQVFVEKATHRKHTLQQTNNKLTTNNMIYKSLAGKGRFSLTEAVEILELYWDNKKVSRRPASTTEVTESCAMLFELEGSDDTNRCDGFGAWSPMGSSVVTARYPVTTSSGSRVTKEVTVRRSYWTNSQEKKLKRQEYRLIGTNRVSLIYLMPLDYSTEVFKPCVHKNTYGNGNNYQRVPSVIREDTRVLIESGKTPKQVHQALLTRIDLTNDAETIVAQMKQTPKLKSIQNMTHNMRQITTQYERILAMMKVGTYGIRDVSFIDDTLCIIHFTEHQLKMFSELEDGMFTYDTTFDIGDFYVSFLTTKVTYIEGEPLVIGPMMIHTSKTEEAHVKFFQKVKVFGLDIVHIGTDSELAIVNAIEKVFPNAAHVVCFRHFISRLEMKMNTLKINKDDQVKIRILFTGRDDCAGIFDVSFDSFEKQYECLKRSVIKIVGRPTGAKLNEFIEKKRGIVRDHMLLDVRKYANLSDGFWYSNNAESANNMIKSPLNRMKKTIPDFIDYVKEYTENQEKEIIMARLGIGRFCLKEDEKVNNGMTVEQFHRCSTHTDQLKQQIQKEVDEILDQRELDEGKQKQLSVNIHDITKLNSVVCDELVRDALSVLNDKSIRRVDLPETHPILIVKGNDQTVCRINFRHPIDSDCVQFKQYSICYHIVAACEYCDDYDYLHRKYSKRSSTIQLVFGKALSTDKKDQVKSGKKAHKSKQKRTLRTGKAPLPKTVEFSNWNEGSREELVEVGSSTSPSHSPVHKKTRVESIEISPETSPETPPASTQVIRRSSRKRKPRQLSQFEQLLNK